MNVQTYASIRDYWGSYHHHKERMAFGATAVYLAAATAVVFKAPSIWPPRVPPEVIAVVMAMSAILAFLFAEWQLGKRETAAAIVEACSHLIASDGTDAPTPSGAATEWRGVPLPNTIVAKLEEMAGKPGFMEEPRKSRCITRAAMGLRTIAALVAVLA